MSISEIPSPLADQINLLKGEISKLSAYDAEFARSLIKQFTVKGALSEKQIPYVGKLVDKVTGLTSHVPTAPKPALPVAPGAYEAFLQATSAAAKYPAVVIAIREDEADKQDRRALRLAKVPGKTYLRLQYRADFERGDWIYVGALRPDASVSFSFDVKWLKGFDKTEALARLQEFGEDVATILAKTGVFFGICANCGRTLTHPVSVKLGIGPVCVTLFPSLAATYASAMALYAAAEKGAK